MVVADGVKLSSVGGNGVGRSDVFQMGDDSEAINCGAEILMVVNIKAPHCQY